MTTRKTGISKGKASKTVGKKRVKRTSQDFALAEGELGRVYGGRKKTKRKATKRKSTKTDY